MKLNKAPKFNARFLVSLQPTPLHSTNTMSLAQLPEELLNKIFKYLCPVEYDPTELYTQTLSSISKASRQFHRIIEPLLYRHVQCRFIKEPGNSKPVGGAALVRALQTRPNRMRCVKSFKAIQNAHESSTVVDSKQYPIDHVIRRIMGLECLDISEISAPAVIDLGNWLGSFSIYTRLNRLNASISYTTIFDLLPLFMLPSLRSMNLELEYLYETTESNYYNVRDWKGLSSSLTHISLSCLNVNRFIDLSRERDIFDLFQVLGTACPLLRDFELSLASFHGDQCDYFYRALTYVFWEQLKGSILRSFKLWSSDGRNQLSARDVPASVADAWRASNIETLKLDSGFLLREAMALAQAALPPSLRQLTVRYHPCHQFLPLKQDEVLTFLLNSINPLLSRLENRERTPNFEVFVLELPRSAVPKAEGGVLLEGKGIRTIITDDYVHLKIVYQYQGASPCTHFNVGKFERVKKISVNE